MIGGSDLIFEAPKQSLRASIEWRSLLEGRRFNFKMEWTSRLGFWTLDILDVSRNDLVLGLRMVNGMDLIAPFSHLEAFPSGQLFVEDGGGLYREPGRTSFASSHHLIYRPSDVVATAEGTDDEIF